MHIRGMKTARNALAALMLAACSARGYAVDPDYDVRIDDLTPAGRMESQVHAVYVPSGVRAPDDDVRSGFHVLQVSPVFSWGIAKNVDVELQLFLSAGPRGEYRVGGAKVELAWVP